MPSFGSCVKGPWRARIMGGSTIATVVGLLVGLSMGSSASAAVDVVCDQRFTVRVDGTNLDLPYCATVDLEEGDRSVERAVVVVHGGSRNADDYFRYARDAGIMSDADQTTVVVAPQFLTEDDIEGHNLPDSVLYWTSKNWKRGRSSEDTCGNPRPFTLSSFAVMDRILEQLADPDVYPELTEIVVAGHSSGAQFTNFYAAGGVAQANLTRIRPNLSFRYVVANPSSYLYLSPERAEPGTTTSFAIPDATGCTWYDDYKYGLQDLNTYMGAVGAASIEERYASRQVVTLLGLEDNDPYGEGLDRTCAAMLQGRHRLERGEIFYNHLQDHFGAAILQRHFLDYIANVGHSARGTFQSDCGLFYLYDFVTTETSCAGQIPEQVVFAASFEDGWGDWVEDAQDDWFRSSLRARDLDRSAQVDGNADDAALVSPEIDLLGATHATIAFSWYIESGLDSGEYLGFDYSSNGGLSWVEAARLRGNVDQESTWHNVSVELQGVDTIRLRFRGRMSKSSEDGNVDDVSVTVGDRAL